MLIENAIAEIIKEYGYEVLESEKRFCSFITDCMGNDIQDRNAFFDYEACCANGFLPYALELYMVSEREQLINITNKARRYLVDRKRLSEDCAISGINIFLKAFGKAYRIPRYQKEMIKKSSNNGNAVRMRKDKESSKHEYLFDQETPVESKKKFIECFEKACTGDVIAMLTVADCYRKGNVVKKNWRLAITWYEKITQNSYADVDKNIIVEAKEKLVELYNELGDFSHR